MQHSEEQRRAARAAEPRVAIVAGAGTGKTEVMALRVRELQARGIHPDNILVCTFTIAAAEELRARIEVAGETPPMISTLHGWAYWQIRANPAPFGLTDEFTVYDPVDAGDLVREAAADCGRAGGGAKRPPEVEALYRQRLRDANAIDYDQLMVEMEAALTGQRGTAGDAIRASARHVLVDEAQDLDDLQHAALEAMKADSITMVGDPRQSLYQFRGAVPRLFDDYATDSALYDLTENRRSVEPIVTLANGVFQRTGYAPMTATRGPGAPVEALIRETDQVHRSVAQLVAEGIPANEIAVLGRRWSDLAIAAGALRAAGIRTAYYGPDRSPWESTNGRAIARWVRLASNPTDDNLVALILGATNPGKSCATLRADAREAKVSLLQMAQQRGLLPPHPEGTGAADHARAFLDHVKWPVEGPTKWVLTRLDDVRRRTLKAFRWWWTFGRSAAVADSAEFAASDAVHLTTIHGAKGCAWRAVVLIRCDSRSFRGNPIQPKDDRNALYVALTRARDRLILQRPKDDEERGPFYPPAYLPEIPWQE